MARRGSTKDRSKSHSGRVPANASGPVQTALSKLPGPRLHHTLGAVSPGSSDRILAFVVTNLGPLSESRVIRPELQGLELTDLRANGSSPDSLEDAHDNPIAAGAEERIGFRDRRTEAAFEIAAQST